MFFSLAVLELCERLFLMSVKAKYDNGIFRPLERVPDAVPGKVYSVFSEEELRSLTENFTWLKAAEKSFEFWNNEEDAAYDNGSCLLFFTRYRSFSNASTSAISSAKPRPPL